MLLLQVEPLIFEPRTVPASRQDGISKYVDEMFDSAFNETQIAGDLPNLRWGRIDYFDVTAITTRWAVWRCVFHNNQRISFQLFTFTSVELRTLLF